MHGPCNGVAAFPLPVHPCGLYGVSVSQRTILFSGSRSGYALRRNGWGWLLINHVSLEESGADWSIPVVGPEADRMEIPTAMFRYGIYVDTHTICFRRNRSMLSISYQYILFPYLEKVIWASSRRMRRNRSVHPRYFMASCLLSHRLGVDSTCMVFRVRGISYCIISLNLSTILFSRSMYQSNRSFPVST